MHRCVTYGVITLIFLAVSPAAFGDSLWDHNGSVMRLVAEGDSRTILYEKPKPLLRGAGVERGTLLFEGYRVGNEYVGTARRFSKNCSAPLTYAVAGRVFGETKIVLQGRRKVYDQWCHPTGRFARDTLMFTYLHGAADTLSMSQSKSRKAVPLDFVGVWTQAATENAQCKAADFDLHENDSLLRVKQDAIEMWESGCEVISASVFPNNAMQSTIQVDFRCGGEGMTWRSNEIWNLQQAQGKETLIIAVVGTSDWRDDLGRRMQSADQGPSVERYLRCQ